jgi:hypothetical protein
MAAAKRGNAARKSGGTHRGVQAAASSKQRRGRKAGRYSDEAAGFSAGRSARAFDAEFAQPVSDGMEQIMRSWMGFFQRAALTQQRLMHDMLELGSGRRAFEAQRAFIDDSLRNLADSTKEVLRASGQLAEPAVRGAERVAEFGQAYSDHERAQHRGSGNGGGGLSERRRQEETRRF